MCNRRSIGPSAAASTATEPPSGLIDPRVRTRGFTPAAASAEDARVSTTALSPPFAAFSPETKKQGVNGSANISLPSAFNGGRVLVDSGGKLVSVAAEDGVGVACGITGGLVATIVAGGWGTSWMRLATISSRNAVISLAFSLTRVPNSRNNFVISEASCSPSAEASRRASAVLLLSSTRALSSASCENLDRSSANCSCKRPSK